VRGDRGNPVPYRERRALRVRRDTRKHVINRIITCNRGRRSGPPALGQNKAGGQAAGTMILLFNADTPPWPQFFLTRAIGSEDLPDVEILTLPSYQSADAISDLEELRRRIMTREDFEIVGGSSIDRGGTECAGCLFCERLVTAA
jgi:hypothetical protein